MKITNSIILSVLLATSIFYARSSTAECTNSPTQFEPTNESISVGDRPKQAVYYTLLSKDSNTQFGCTVDKTKVISFAIPDDSSLSVVDVQLYINGRKLKPRRMTRGHAMKVVLTSDKVQDYKLEFKLVGANSYGSSLLSMLICVQIDSW